MPRSNGMSEGDFIMKARNDAIDSGQKYWHGGEGRFLTPAEVKKLPRPRTAT